MRPPSLRSVLASFLMLGATWVAAQEFPNRPLRMVVPFPPGGSNDILGRFLAQGLAERLRQPVVVENRPGADGMIGTEMVSRSEPDGYTLLIVSTSYAMNPAIHKTPFDPLKSLAPVAQIATGANVIAVGPAVPYATLAELLEAARAKPGRLRYASSGIGGFNHFGGELFNLTAGVKLEHVPYKGGGPAMVDVMGGQVEVLISTLIQAIPHIRSGKLRALAVGSSRRSPAFPDIPTIAEAGLPGYDGTIWWGILTRGGTPAPVIARLNSEINAAMRSAEAAKRLAAEAADPVFETPEAFGKLIANDLVKYARIAREAGIKAQ